MQAPRTVNSVVDEKRSVSETVFGGSGQPMDIDAFKRQGLCFNCSQRGHLAKDCPLRKPVQVRQVQVPASVEEVDQMIKMLQELKKDF